MKKVFITPRSFPFQDAGISAMLRQYGLETERNLTGRTLTEEEMAEACRDAEGVIVGIDPMGARVLEQAEKLKVISKYGIGTDNIDLATADRLGIRVLTAAGANARSVAELTVGLFFSLARGIPSSAARVKQGGWERSRGVELYGKTAGIMGFGRIGREVARMLLGIGMMVWAYDPFLSEELCPPGVQKSGWDEVIEKADFLTLHLPLSERTRRIIGKQVLERMKPSSYLVNTSRGELVDEDALYEALVSGKLSGAAQDVFSVEPPGEHRLLTLENFILTPHTGAYTAEAVMNMAVYSVRNLGEAMRE